MGTQDYDKILNEIHVVKLNLHDLEGKIDDIEREMKNEMNLEVQKAEWTNKEYDRRISFTEKLLFGTAGFILLTFLGALVATVLK